MFSLVYLNRHILIHLLIVNGFSLFADIQEFYELTLLDDTKTIHQKTVETLQIASKWEQENSLKISDVSVSHSFENGFMILCLCRFWYNSCVISIL